MPTSKRKEEGLQACRNKRVVGTLALEQRVNDLILEALTWPDNARELYLEIKRATERRAQAARKGEKPADAVKLRAEIRRIELQLRRHVAASPPFRSLPFWQSRFHRVRMSQAPSIALPSYRV